MLDEVATDTKVYKPGSTRMTAASKAEEGVPINEIMKMGDWSRQTTCKKHYKQQMLEENRFAQAVLPRNKIKHNFGKTKRTEA